MALGAFVLLSLSACTGYSLDCGPMPQDDCATRSAEIVAIVSREFPSRRITAIVMSDAQGHAEVVLDDGAKVGFADRLSMPAK